MKLDGSIVISSLSRAETQDADESELREALGMAARPAPPRLQPGQILDDAYRIEEKIGEGGMGRVYRAKDIRLERDVAIKVHALVTVGGRQWTYREAAALAQLSHANVVTVFEVGTYEEHPWVAMQYVPGGTARTWLHERARTPAEIVALYIAAGRGLAAAHAAGIVHRDFKPDNVLVSTDGQPRVADFGLALELAKMPDADLTVGTPAYMASEQWSGTQVRAAADQFAFAVSLWEALTGKRPFAGATAAELREAQRQPPGRPAKPLARHVEAALRRALSFDPGDRWPAMEPLLAALGRDPRRARRRAFLAVGGAALLVGAGVAIASYARERTGDAPCGTATAKAARVATLRSKLAVAPDDRAVAKLDRWIDRWRTARLAACEATYVERTQPLTLLELRELCFDRALAGAEATLGELANAATDRARLVDQLPVLTDCDDVALLARVAPLPKEPARRAAIEDVAGGIAKVEVLRAATKFPEATTLLAQLEPRAASTGRKDLLAEIHLAKGVLGIATNKLAGVQAEFEAAAKLGAEAGDDRIVARAWLDVLDLLAARLEKPEEAARMIPVAEAAVLRAGNTPRLRADLLGTLGDLTLARGDLAAARAQYTEAVALHERVFGEDAELARKLNRLASIANALDDPGAARAHLQRAADLLERMYGPRYRHLAVIWTTLGAVEYRTASFAAARTLEERALALKEEVGGKDSPTLVPTLTDLAQTLIEMRDFDLARTHVDRALAIARKAYGPEHAKVVDALLVLARLQVARDDWRGAAETITLAQATQLRLGQARPLDQIELVLAEVLLHDKRYDDARAALDRASPIVLAQGAESYMAAELLEARGRLEQARAHRAEAHAAFERAHALLTARRGAEHPETREARARVDATR